MNTSSVVRNSLWLSLISSVISLGLKFAGFSLTGSNTVLSDAAESVVHVFAVAFVLFGYYLSVKPADETHLYGHERIEFLSVGVEGLVIILAGVSILLHAIDSIVNGIVLQNISTGMMFIGAATLLNLATGSYVLSVGRRENHMIAISNGKHTLTDVWTSGAALLTLWIISVTDLLFLDIVVSIALAVFIIYEATKLLRFAVDGIMDKKDTQVHDALLSVLESPLPGHILDWHNLRHRSSGRTTWVELHLVFDKDLPIETAHADATLLERKLMDALQEDAVVTLHFEPNLPDHAIHAVLNGAYKNRRLEEFN